jgi:hypothetical protein
MRGLAHMDPFGARLCFLEQAPVDESVVEYDIRFAETFHAANCDQIRAARPRTDDINRSDAPGIVFRGHSETFSQELIVD